MTGVELIAQERAEQIEKHGKTIASDVKLNQKADLSNGALAILTGNNLTFPPHWNEALVEKLLSKPYRERLIIAGALIAAEIDRDIAAKGAV